MALVILAHPDIKNSIANKTIAEELRRAVPGVEIRNIFQLNADYRIDARQEQAALLRHDLIILQYPMYWYSMPAILKIWFDQVFTYQFAYGSQGDKLKGKLLLPSLTVGQAEENFRQQDGLSIIDNLLLPVKKSAEYAQMNYLDPAILFDIATVTGHTEAEIKQKATEHSKKLIDIIHTAAVSRHSLA